MLRRQLHRPAHLYRSSAVYFVTAGTVEAAQWLHVPERRQIVLAVLDRVTREEGRGLYAWFVGEDHYHVLLGGGEVPLVPLLGATAGPDVTKRFDLGRWARRVHAVSATLLNRLDGTPGRRGFSQYWDRCMRSEGEMYATVNYIHQNPVKHGFVETLEGARRYPQCSLGRFIGRYGEEFVGECFARYPVKDFTSLDEQG